MVDGKRQKTIVIGAGPVGALAALYAAQRGHDVEVYELRGDLRDPSTTPLNFTKSINLALSERGINAMRHSGRLSLLENVLSKTIPMRGRMIHGKKASGELYEQAQDYDIHGRTLFAVDRGEINKTLLDDLESMSNVKFFFNHKLTGADFKNKKAWFEIPRSEASSDRRNPEIEKDFDLLIGADGAHSAARYHLMKYARLDYQQTYIDTLWCEFTITARDLPASSDTESKFAISPNHLHIWPGKDFMFIAIPSLDGSFTCTLFLPSAQILPLETDPLLLPRFFDHHFPGVTSLIPPMTLIQSFQSNPHLPLISIKCSPYHFSSSAVIVGDAAHAMVPFYGQGMNSGLEDIRVLFSILDTHFPPPDPSHSSVIPQPVLEKVLAEYSAHRAPDAHAINDLALQNYIEMRSSVTSPVYLLRKYLEETLSVLFPRLDWATKYSRVSFGNERYSDVVRRSEDQGRTLVLGLVGGVGVPILVAGVGLWLRLRRARRGELGFGLRF